MQGQMSLAVVHRILLLICILGRLVDGPITAGYRFMSNVSWVSIRYLLVTSE